MSNVKAYGKLCSIFYDITKKYASDKEVDFYSSFIKQKEGKILEAMSGSGRLLIPLLQRGYSVDGVDNSRIMLERCRERCRELSLSPILHEQSLEEFKSPDTYSLVTIAVGSFQLITDHARALQALKNLHDHMHEGSSLLIDIFIPEVNADSSTRIATINHNSAIRLTTRQVINQQEKLADAYCSYDLIVNGVIQEQEKELIQVTWYSDDEISALLKAAHFEVLDIYTISFRSDIFSRIVHARYC